MPKILRNTLVLVIVLALSCGAAIGGSQAEQVNYASLGAVEVASIAGSSPQKNSELAGKFAEFRKFTEEKVMQLNRSHRFSRSRMEITRQPDGSYRARYHHIDDTNLGVKVSRSQSRSIPFVGVLSYSEQVFEAFAKSPEAFSSEIFSIVQIIPNRHIFSYKKGVWD